MRRLVLQDESPIRNQLSELIRSFDVVELSLERRVELIALSFDKILEHLAVEYPGDWGSESFDERYDEVKGRFRQMLDQMSDLLAPHFNSRVLRALVEKYQEQQTESQSTIDRINNILTESQDDRGHNLTIRSFINAGNMRCLLRAYEAEARTNRITPAKVFGYVTSSAAVGGAASTAVIAATGGTLTTAAALTPIGIGIGVGFGLMLLLYGLYEGYQRQVVSDRINRLTNLFNGRTTNDIFKSKFISRMICECLGDLAAEQLNRNNERIETAVLGAR